MKYLKTIWNAFVTCCVILSFATWIGVVCYALAIAVKYIASVIC